METQDNQETHARQRVIWPAPTYGNTTHLPDIDNTPYVEAKLKPASMCQRVGAEFNIPIGLDLQVPPRLMEDEEIERLRNIELHCTQSVDFELQEGDTLVLLDYPDTYSSPLRKSDCNGLSYKSRVFRVHSEKLKALASDEFANMFDNHYQRRIKLKKFNGNLPLGVDYVLDLTPPTEGDELVFQMTELSLTPGITKWWASSLLHKVDPFLVCGHDDVCVCRRDMFNNLIKNDEPSEPNNPNSSSTSKEQDGSTDPEAPQSEEQRDATRLRNAQEKTNQKPHLPLNLTDALKMKRNNNNKLYDVPDYRRLPDYCPFRHRNGIIRLLRLIEGKPVTLDSAPRIWTMVKLATIFDCTSVVRDLVARWIMHGPNAYFIEVLPEEALRIACDLKLPDIAQCAFRILVNEMAIDQAATSQQSTRPRKTTVFGREVGDIPDELRNSIQHAARALVERVTAIHHRFQSPAIFDNVNSKDWKTLQRLRELLIRNNGPLYTKALKDLTLLMDSLILQVRSPYNNAVNRNSFVFSAACTSLDCDRLTYVKPVDFESMICLLPQLNHIQRLLCSITYNELGNNLDHRIFRETVLSKTGSRLKILGTLALDVTEALEKIVSDDPSLVNHPDWSLFFDPAPDPAPDPALNAWERVRSPIIDLKRLELDTKQALRPITLSWVRHKSIPMPLILTRHLLLTLEENEMKYLPIWAGGNDDGSGGVFADAIPPAELGPSGPGPAFHTGITNPSTASTTGSIVSDLEDLRVWGSMTAASVDVQDSISTVYRPDHVIAETGSIASESFTSNSSDFQDAKYRVPANHQPMGQAIATMVDADDSETSSSKDYEMVYDADDMGSWSDSDGDSVMTIGRTKD